MPENKPLYIQLTSIWGVAVTLSPMFDLYSVSEKLNTSNTGGFFGFRTNEIEEMRGYINRAVGRKGLNPKKLHFDTPDWGGMVPIWAKYAHFKNFDKENYLLNNFNVAHTLIITPMQRTYEEYVNHGEFGNYETRVEIVRESVIRPVAKVMGFTGNRYCDSMMRALEALSSCRSLTHNTFYTSANSAV